MNEAADAAAAPAPESEPELDAETEAPDAGEPGSPEPGSRVADRSRAVTLTTVTVVAVLLGVVLRVWTLASPLRHVDADEATVGLMAQHTLDGHVEAFFWGQVYGSAHEATVSALFMALRVPHFLALKAGPLLFFALGAVLFWRLARRAVDDHLARLAGALLWAAPATVVWMSTKARGFYGATFALGIGVFLFAARLEERWQPRDAVVLGLLVGSAFYASPQSAYFLVPGALWLALRAWRAGNAGALVRAAPLVLLGIVVGALPWIWANANRDWASLRSPEALPETSFTDRLDLFTDRGLPVALGLRDLFTGHWIGGRVGQLLYPLAVVTLVAGVLLARRRPRVMLLGALAVLAYPLVFAALRTSFFLADPRYVTFLVPPLLLVGVWVAARVGWPVVAVVAAGIMALSAVTVLRFDADDHEGRWDVAAGDIAPAVDVLDRRGIERVFAEYWIAHRVSFRTEERLVASPLELIRHVPYERAVRREAVPAYLMFDAGHQLEWLLEHLEGSGIPFRTTEAGHYLLVEPAQRLLPEQVAPVWEDTRRRAGVL